MKFSDGTYYFNNFPGNLIIYDFAITVKVLGDKDTLPLDKRIELTVVAVMGAFLSEKENSVIYICDDSDNRQRARKRKYDSWYNMNENKEIEKHDLNIQYEDLEVLTSLVINKSNSNKDLIVSLLLNQKKELLANKNQDLL